MRSPKLASDRSKDWYRYYAGYSPDFVEDALDRLGLDGDQLVVDPWNGSGTTTTVAQVRGIPAVGYDFNPALVMVARSRLLRSDVAESIVPLMEDLITHASRLDVEDSGRDDPLTMWFGSSATREARGIEVAIRRVLVDERPPDPAVPKSPASSSSLAALFYVALFQAVRSQLRPFVTSNPTWVKVARADEVLSLAPGTLRAAFRTACLLLAERVRAQDRPDTAVVARVEVAKSSALPLDPDSATAVIASPPYCTRIDYVVAMLPELAVLGLSREEIRDLRMDMIGTPTITTDIPEPSGTWGRTANLLISRISQHQSRASKTYYRKYFLQYFGAMQSSLVELRRVLTPDGRAVLVLQDSYYKNIHVDLATIVAEMGSSLGFKVEQRTDFATGRTKAAINPKARSWRSTFEATESVLIFGEE